MIVRRVGVWSVARLYGAMMAVGGLIGGILFALIGTVGGLAGALGSSDTKAGLAAGGLSAIFGLGAIIILPICYGVMGIAVGAIGAWLYNVFAGYFGGIEVDVQQ
jgi:hypothetical protein